MYRGLYQCKGCSMQLTLFGPVTRPCPSCGGEFELMMPYEEIQHPMQVFDEWVMNPQAIIARSLDERVAAEFPEMILELERLTGSANG